MLKGRCSLWSENSPRTASWLFLDTHRGDSVNRFSLFTFPSTPRAGTCFLRFLRLGKSGLNPVRATSSFVLIQPRVCRPYGLFKLANTLLTQRARPFKISAIEESETLRLFLKTLIHSRLLRFLHNLLFRLLFLFPILSTFPSCSRTFRFVSRELSVQK